MLQLKNTTKFSAKMAIFPNEDAIDTLYVVVKASFDMGKDITLADMQAPPVEADIYWTEPGESSLKYASDMHIGKSATDIVMLGHACAPDKKEVTQLDVDLKVGTINKSIRVFGDRQWQGGQITRPQPFKTMPLVYEKAYGGVHKIDGKVDSADARNPLGIGYLGKRTQQEMIGMPLPNLEDPRHLIRDPSDQPTPACFAYIAPNWNPRAGFAGTYDETWRTTRAPYLPTDYDKRFLNTAHPDLIYSDFMQGGESVRITNMHPRGALEFELPQVGLDALISIEDKTYQPELQLDTLILEPNQLKFSMVWRAALPCDKKMLKISNVTVALAR